MGICEYACTHMRAYRSILIGEVVSKGKKEVLVAICMCGRV